MPDLWMDVDVALSEVPVNIAPLIDDTDFKSIEGAVAYNAAGMTLFWHFVTTGGAYTLTAVTPTTGGDYDWTDQGAAGIYTIEIPASGGASINNDTEGFGWFTGVATGVLPWRGPTIGFRLAALNDVLIDATDAKGLGIVSGPGILDTGGSGTFTLPAGQRANVAAGDTLYVTGKGARIIAAGYNSTSGAGTTVSAGDSAFAASDPYVVYKLPKAEPFTSTDFPAGLKVSARVDDIAGTGVQGAGTAADPWRPV